MDISKIEWSLYAIIDKDFVRNRPIKRIAEELIAGGAGVIQLRNKSSNANEFYFDAVEVKAVTHHYDIPLIINDRLDIAVAVKAEGVHVGQNDLPLCVVRDVIGEEKIVGISVHNLQEFDAALNDDPTYFGVGTIYPTNTKDKTNITGTKFLKELRPKTALPLIAIGGINLENLAPVIQTGADGVAVISALLNEENLRHRAHQFVNRIKSVRATSERI